MRSSKWLLAIGLAVPMAITVVGSGDVAVAAPGGTSCSRSSGTATFKPPLPVSGSSQKVKPTITVKRAKTARCKGGGVKSGTFASKSKFRTATNCDTLLSGNPTPRPPVGTITMTWNTGKKSTAKVTLDTVNGEPTQTHVSGNVTKGLFKGKHLDATLNFAPKQGDCITSPLKAVTFSLVGKLTIG